MRVDYKILKNIEKLYGSDDFEVGNSFSHLNPKGKIDLRFGYWKQVNLDELKKLLPYRYVVIENEVDESEFGQILYDYTIQSISDLNS